MQMIEKAISPEALEAFKKLETPQEARANNRHERRIDEREKRLAERERALAVIMGTNRE